MSSLSENIKGINAWSENANRHIENISAQLTEIENLLENKIPENDINLMEILEFVDYIQVQHSSIVEKITSDKEKDYAEMKDHLQNQLDLLNRTFKLLEIELKEKT